VRIPLGVKFPSGSGVAPGTRRARVEIADVMPTLLDYLGLLPVDDVQGRSLMPLLRGEAWQERPIYLYSSTTRELGVLDGAHKFLFDPRIRDLQDWKARQLARRSAQSPTFRLDPETTRQLRSLGYVE
jgi:arylsulfatase A-like enzyme